MNEQTSSRKSGSTQTVAIEQRERETVVAETGGQHRPTIILDLGSASKKEIDRLREGRGALMQDVESAIEGIRQAGDLPESTVPVVVVVKQKRKKMPVSPLDFLPVRIG